MFKNLKIATKLLLFGISVMIIPLITVGISSVSIAGKGLTRLAEEQMSERAKELALLVDYVISDEMKIVKNLALLDVSIDASVSVYKDDSSEKSNKINALNKTFSKILKTEGLGEHYQVLLAADKSGIVFAASENNYLGVFVKDRDYIVNALKGKPNIGAVGINKVTGEPFIPFAVPVYSTEGSVIGAVATIVEISFLNNIITNSKIGDTGYAFIIDNTGLVIAHPDSKLNLKLNITELEGMEQYAANMIAGKSGVEKYIFEGDSKSCGYAPVKSTGWSLALTLPDSEFLAPVVLVRNIVALVGISALIIGIAVSLLFARSISTKLRASVDFASKIASGDLSASMDIDQKDEIGQLANSLKDMAENLNRILLDIQNASNQVASGSQQISSTSQQISSGATEQASSTEEVSSAMEELVANIQQNTESSKSADDISKKVAVEAAEGGEAVNETVAAMKSIAEKITIIEDIARNTNMLALNAAIEAARAGDAGKGFAVVASEVRKLAENSGSAAAEIIDISINSVKAAEKAGNLINDLVPQIQNTAELIQEINTSSIEQNRGADQINQALQQLDTVIQQNASSSEEMASMAEELSSQSELMKSNVDFFKLSGSEQIYSAVPETVKETEEKKNSSAGKTKKPETEKSYDYDNNDGFSEF